MTAPEGPLERPETDEPAPGARQCLSGYYDRQTGSMRCRFLEGHKGRHEGTSYWGKPVRWQSIR